MSSDKLAKFLREISNWSWEEFVKAEKDKQYTTNESIIFALIRSCAMQELAAIKISLNRLDGKLKTPVKVEMPKVFYLFPNAKLPDGISAPVGPPAEPGAKPGTEALIGEIIPAPKKTKTEEKDLPSMSLRETLREMSDYPRELPEAIIQLAEQTHRWIQQQGPKPPEIPKVKSVVAAHLLIMAQKRNIDALTEVFDQIDGKLVETIQILGEDIYITSYANAAPEGAYLNEDGILQMEAVAAQQMWANKLGEQNR